MSLVLLCVGYGRCVVLWSVLIAVVADYDIRCLATAVCECDLMLYDVVVRC